MDTRGDRDHATGGRGRSFHAVRPDAFNYVWDNSIEPELEVDSGEVVEFRVRDASDEQLTADSISEDVVKLDFDHVNPVSGPVYVRDARPGDVLAVEILEFRPMEWGWTALIPGFGLLADEFPEPWLRNALPIHAAKRSGVGYCRPGRGLRASLVRGFRAGSISR
jgi:acetamidase/formamidase